jgi:hypothetical protein
MIQIGRMTIPTLTALLLFGVTATNVQASDWLTLPSRYTHSSRSGYRVNQFQPIAPVYHTPNPNRSVYRSVRSTLQVGDSADYYHFVDQYGDTVRPYGEWRFPNRPFSAPYSMWGPQPYGGTGFDYGYPVPYGGVGGLGGGIGSPYGPYGVINGAGFPPPWTNGYYPDVTRQLTPPQPLPVPSPTFNNQIFGNENTIQNQ